MNDCNKIHSYDFFKKRFEEGWNYGKGWKSYYYNETNRMFERKYGGTNRWGYCIQNGKTGVLLPNGDWDPNLNRPNTHAPLCHYFYEKSIKDGVVYLDFNDPNNYEHNAKLLIGNVESHFYTYFEDVNSEEYKIIYKKLNKSWLTNNVSLIQSVLSVNECYDDINDLKFGFGVGDVKDFAGIDLEFQRNGDSEYTTVQIKSGNGYIFDGDNFLINEGAVNSGEYDTDLYIYTDTRMYYGISSTIIFKNPGKLDRDDEDRIIVKLKNHIYNKIKPMPIPEHIQEIGEILANNQFNLTITSDGELNFVKIDYETKSTTINFVDYKDETFEKVLEEKYDELKDFFK